MARKQPETLRDQLLADEGFRRKVYRCTGGYLTIGVGRNVEGKGLTREEAEFLLDNDIRECVKSLLSRYDWFYNLQRYHKVRAEAIINMRFQLGAGGFRAFKNTRKALSTYKWEEAARQMLDSAWAKQTPRRARRLAKQIRTGIRQ